MYLLKLALRPWRLALMSQVFSGVAVGFLLLMMGFLFWMQQGLRAVVVRLQGEQVVTAYLDKSVSEQDEKKILEAVQDKFQSQAKARRPEVKLVSSDQFVGAIQSQYPDLARELLGLGADMKQVVPRYISATGMISAADIEKLKDVTGIESVESSHDRYRNTVGAFSTMRWIAKILMCGICFALLTGLIHLSRMNSYLHSDALTLLKFWGAGSGVLVGPGVFSGLLVGLMGGVIASFGWLSGGSWLARHVQSLSGLLREMPSLRFDLAFVLLVSGAIIGIIAGFLGSFPLETRPALRSTYQGGSQV